MRHVHGPHVYDDQSDQWYRFDSEDEAVNFAAQGETMRYVPTVREATATVARSGYVLFNGNSPQTALVSGKDLSRTRLSVSLLYNGAGADDKFSVLLGTQREVMSRVGLVLYDISNSSSGFIFYGDWNTSLRHTDDVYVSFGASVSDPSAPIMSSAPIMVTWVAEYTVS